VSLPRPGPGERIDAGGDPRRSAGDRRAHAARRGGITLIELLIAIALIVALGALVVPDLAAQLGRRRWEAASDGLVRQIALARAEAQRTGEAIEVIQRPLDPGDRRGPLIVARRLTAGIGAAAFEDAQRPAGRRRGGNDLAATDGPAPLDDFMDDGPEDDRALAFGWAELRLQSGVRLTTEEPTPERFGPDALAADPLGGERLDDQLEDPMSGPIAAGDGPLRLAILLPDGSALPGRPAWLIDGEGRAARLRIDAWTGMVTLEPVVFDDTGLAEDEDVVDEEFDADADEDRTNDRADEREAADEPRRPAGPQSNGPADRSAPASAPAPGSRSPSGGEDEGSGTDDEDLEEDA